ncbi:beta-xylosidase [Streptomyces sp. NPDC020917]|uniref:beta-xylosidase n=1 Tax=Streptomyces sp. NPDC020917 TaxID=3365102 RepID=UPI0037A6DD21
MFRPKLPLHPASRDRRRSRAVAGLAALAAAALTFGTLSTSTAVAATTTVSVNLADQGAAPNHAGSGFLYGLSQDGSGPADDLLEPLKPTLFRGGGARIDGHGWIGDNYQAGPGYKARINSALAQARRVTAEPYNATYHLLVSDVWGADTTQPSNTVWPCAKGDCANYKTFIDQVISDVKASGVKVSYDIWNEPTGAGFFPPGMNTAQYFQVWDTAVREIRRLQPGAQIVGPSWWTYDRNVLSTFLRQTKTDDTLPDVLNWHFGGDPAVDAANARQLVASLGIPPLPMTVNEFTHSAQQNPANGAWLLSRLSVSGVTAAAHAIWNDCCVAGRLDGMLVDGKPTGEWWTYRAYAQLRGHQLGTTASGGIAVAASLSQGENKAFALIGNSSGQSGPTTVDFQNLQAAPHLVRDGKVHVKIQRIPNEMPLKTPYTVFDSDLTPDGSTLQVPVNRLSGTDAYTVTLTRGDGKSGPTEPGPVVVDGADTGADSPDHFSYDANWGVATGISDMYNSTANYSHTAGATATLHFQGSQVALHAVRDVDQGIMSVVLDGSTPITIDNYASSRNASGIVWTSPVLTPGPHTVTIVNTGQRNNASKGINIALDRADVN